MTEKPVGPEEDQAHALERLRQLLVGPEQLRLDELREEVAHAQLDPAEVGRVLPDAVTARGADDLQLSEALSPSVERAIATSVKRNPKVLTDAIFPLIGPAIRKSISQALVGLTESINRTLEHSFSPRGLRWRLDAWRTGVPFSGVVLKNSLIFRVEQAYLIHRETGLLLVHVSAPGIPHSDPDMVSAMLGAIGDFVQDSFDPGQNSSDGSSDDSSISQIEFGDRVLEVARSPTAVLACEVRGTLDSKLRTRIQETLEAIHIQYSAILRDFDGDANRFLRARPSLEALLVEERPQKKEKSRGVPILASVVGVALVTLLVFWAIRTWDEHQRWEEARANLAAEPGIVLLVEREEDGKYVLGGLLDPHAQNPLDVLLASGFEAEDVRARWAPFQSPEPAMVQRRAQAWLAAPKGVDLVWQDLALAIEGEASHAWVSSARSLLASRALPELESVDLTGLVDRDLERAKVQVAALESQRLDFAEGDSTFAKAAKAEQLAKEFAVFDRDCQAAGLGYRIWIELDGTPGESDPSLDLHRKATLESLLRASMTETHGLWLGGSRVASPGATSQRVRLRVELEEPRL